MTPPTIPATTQAEEAEAGGGRPPAVGAARGDWLAAAARHPRPTARRRSAGDAASGSPVGRLAPAARPPAPALRLDRGRREVDGHRRARPAGRRASAPPACLAVSFPSSSALIEVSSSPRALYMGIGSDVEQAAGNRAKRLSAIGVAPPPRRAARRDRGAARRPAPRATKSRHPGNRRDEIGRLRPDRRRSPPSAARRTGRRRCRRPRERRAHGIVEARRRNRPIGLDRRTAEASPRAAPREIGRRPRAPRDRGSAPAPGRAARGDQLGKRRGVAAPPCGRRRNARVAAAAPRSPRRRRRPAARARRPPRPAEEGADPVPAGEDERARLGTGCRRRRRRRWRAAAATSTSWPSADELAPRSRRHPAPAG